MEFLYKKFVYISIFAHVKIGASMSRKFKFFVYSALFDKHKYTMVSKYIYCYRQPHFLTLEHSKNRKNVKFKAFYPNFKSNWDFFKSRWNLFANLLQRKLEVWLVNPIVATFRHELIWTSNYWMCTRILAVFYLNYWVKAEIEVSAYRVVFRWCLSPSFLYIYEGYV